MTPFQTLAGGVRSIPRSDALFEQEASVKSPADSIQTVVIEPAPTG